MTAPQTGSSRQRMVLFSILWIGAGVSGCDAKFWAASPDSTDSKLSSPEQSTLAQQPSERGKPRGVAIETDRPIAAISSHPVGMNLHVTQDVTRPGILEMLRRTNARIVRWPGGSESDHYQWRSHKLGFNWVANPNSTFSRFTERLVKPAQVDMAITLNYGSDASGKKGGDPKEAAAWVAEARSKGDRVAYWTVGNEVFGSWETDFNQKPHDSGTYASRLAREFYPRIKAADPRAKVGAVVDLYDQVNPFGWTQTVLRKARYDFVEIHYYPQTPDSASDNFLLNGAVSEFQKQVRDLQRTMGNRRVPIILGEFNNVPNRPNKQTLSIVNALYHGLMFAESAKLGLAAVFPWETVEDYCTHAPQTGLSPAGNFSDTLYGWQTFSTYSLFSLGLPNGGKNCGQGIPPIPYGTAFPSAHAAKLFGDFATPNARLLQTNVASQYKTVRAFSASHRQGYRLLLFNLDRNAAVSLPVTLAAAKGDRRWRAQQTTYGKAEYDRSRNNRWDVPVQKTLGNVGSDFTIALPPWSLSVIALDR
jgi:hypothetical protein